MSGLHDSFTVGIILLIVLGAVFFYFYTRLGQTEKRMKLLETILLDLKVATENSFIEFPAAKVSTTSSVDTDDTDDDDDDAEAPEAPPAPKTEEVVEAPIVEEADLIPAAIQEPVVPADIPVASQPTDTYEYMSLKELVSLAKQRGMTGIHKLKRPELLKLLRESAKVFEGDILEELAAASASAAPEEGTDGELFGQMAPLE